MSSARFKVIITVSDIPEEKLGATLAVLPDKGSIQIELTQKRTASEPKAAPAKAPPNVTKSAPIPRPSEVQRGHFGPDWFEVLPQQFRARDFAPVIEAHGFNGNSISHFIRRAVDAKLIQKVPGTQGTSTLYRKLK